MTFKSTYLKLTFFYVLIVMLISIGFSLTLYNLASRELDSGLQKQTRMFREIPPNFYMNQSPPDFEEMRIAQLEESSRSLRINLIYFNLFILFASGFLSYFLSRRTLRPIKEMMESQNRFTSDASHELRTPLTAMKSEIEVSLRNKKMSQAETRELLNSNLEEIEKLDSLSNALLKLAQYEDGKTLSLGKISLEDIIIESYIRIEKRANKKDIKFKNDLKNIRIKGDKDSLIELFVILMDNAIKYSNKQSQISISMSKINNQAIVKVKDQGIGIKEMDLPYIYDRFYRADQSRSKVRADGYGLGLSIAKKIVEMHKGFINIESVPGKGTIVKVMLPLL